MEKEDDMKKALVLALAGILASGFVAVAGPAGAAEYDRYELRTLQRIVLACGGRLDIILEPGPKTHRAA